MGLKPLYQKTKQHKNAILFYMGLLVIFVIKSCFFLPFYHYLIFLRFSSQQRRQVFPSRIELCGRFLALTFVNQIKYKFQNKSMLSDSKILSKCVGACSTVKLNVSQTSPLECVPAHFKTLFSVHVWVPSFIHSRNAGHNR